MRTKKIRIRIRLHTRLQELLEEEAAKRGIRYGTLVNYLIEQEIEKIQNVGFCNCVFLDPEPELDSEKIYVFPSIEDRQLFIPSNGRGIDSGSQVSVFVTKEEHLILDQLVKLEALRGTLKRKSDGSVQILSYRYVIVGLLLNSECLRSLIY